MNKARTAFTRYKANPTGPNAGRNLREAFRNIEEIGDIFVQFKAASSVAEELVSVLNSTKNPVMKESIARIIDIEVKRLAEQSVHKIVLDRAYGNPSHGIGNTSLDPNQRSVNGNINSLQFLLQNFVEANPRFRGLISQGIQVAGANGDLRVTKKRLLQNQWFIMYRWPLVLLAGAIIIFSIKSLLPSKPKIQRIETVKTVKVPVPVKDKGKDKLNLNWYQETITPTDKLVDITARRAIKKRHKGDISLKQIFDIYDWFVANITYLKGAPLPMIPRLPSLVLTTKDGDCKSLSVTLASMLESTGFRTVLFECETPPKKGEFIIQGHMYLGVVISTDENSKGRKRSIARVKRIIKRTYLRKLKHIHPSSYPFEKGFPKLHFRELNVGGRAMALLILDPTLGRASPPGIALLNEKTEKMFVSRPDPDLPFNQPKLR